MEARGEYLLDQPLPLPRAVSGVGVGSSVERRPSGSGRTVGSVPSAAWYNLTLDRDRAAASLTGQPVGTFVVRGRHVSPVALNSFIAI